MLRKSFIHKMQEIKNVDMLHRARTAFADEDIQIAKSILQADELMKRGEFACM